MKRVLLKSITDDYTGELGLVFADIPTINGASATMNSYILAHDYVEHVNGVRNIGSFEDELQALGASWLVRGQFGDMSRDGRGSSYTPEQSLAIGVSDLYCFYFVNTKRKSLKPIRTQSHLCDDVISLILGYAQMNVHRNLSPEDFDTEHLSNYLSMARHYLRKGMRKLERNFKRFDYREPGIAANQLFYNIQDKLKNISHWVEFEGQEFELVINGVDVVYFDEIHEWEEMA